MELKGIFPTLKEDSCGVIKASMKRYLAVFLPIVLCVGFLILCYQRKATWELFIALPIGCVISITPSFLRHDLPELLKIWKGQGDKTDG